MIAYGVFVVLDTAVTFGYLREAVRVLKPGGILAFDLFDTDDDDDRLLRLAEYKSSVGDSRPYLSGRFLGRVLSPMRMRLIERLDFPDGGYTAPAFFFEKTTRAETAP